MIVYIFWCFFHCSSSWSIPPRQPQNQSMTIREANSHELQEYHLASSLVQHRQILHNIIRARLSFVKVFFDPKNRLNSEWVDWNLQRRFLAQRPHLLGCMVMGKGVGRLIQRISDLMAQSDSSQKKTSSSRGAKTVGTPPPATCQPSPSSCQPSMSACMPHLSDL